MQNSYKRTTCRLCDKSELKLAVPISATPIGGAFVSEEHLDKKTTTLPTRYVSM